VARSTEALADRFIGDRGTGGSDGDARNDLPRPSY
jgi:hypothetical protein